MGNRDYLEFSCSFAEHDQVWIPAEQRPLSAEQVMLEQAWMFGD